MANKSHLLTAFNNHFEEFIADICLAFPDDEEIETAANALRKLRKANPKLICNIYKEYVLGPYGEQIMKGDLTYFLEKNYVDDVKDTSQAAAILEKIDKIKQPLASFEEEEKLKIVKYLQNLCQLCSLYN